MDDMPVKSELSLIEMLEGPGRLVIHELSDRVRESDGTPFIRETRWRSVPEAWEDVQERWPSLGRTLFARIRDFTREREKIPSSAIRRLSVKDNNPDLNALDGPDGVTLYDPVFCVEDQRSDWLLSGGSVPNSLAEDTSSEFGYIISRLREDIGFSQAKDEDLRQEIIKFSRSDPARADGLREAKKKEEAHREFLEKQLDDIEKRLRSAAERSHVVLAKDRGGRSENWLMPAFALYLEEEIWPQLPFRPSRTEFVAKMNELNERIRRDSTKKGDNEVLVRLVSLGEEDDGGARTVKNWLKANSVRLGFIWDSAR